MGGCLPGAGSGRTPGLRSLPRRPGAGRGRPSPGAEPSGPNPERAAASASIDTWRGHVPLHYPGNRRGRHGGPGRIGAANPIASYRPLPLAGLGSSGRMAPSRTPATHRGREVVGHRRIVSRALGDRRVSFHHMDASSRCDPPTVDGRDGRPSGPARRSTRMKTTTKRARSRPSSASAGAQVLASSPCRGQNSLRLSKRELIFDYPTRSRRPGREIVYYIAQVATVQPVAALFQPTVKPISMSVLPGPGGADTLLPKRDAGGPRRDALWPPPRRRCRWPLTSRLTRPRPRRTAPIAPMPVPQAPASLATPERSSTRPRMIPFLA